MARRAAPGVSPPAAVRRGPRRSPPSLLPHVSPAPPPFPDALPPRLTRAGWVAARRRQRAPRVRLVLSCRGAGAALCARFSAALRVPIGLPVVLVRVFAGAPSVVGYRGRRGEIRGALPVMG